MKYHETFGYIGALSSGYILDEILMAEERRLPMFKGQDTYWESIFGDLSKATLNKSQQTRI